MSNRKVLTGELSAQDIGFFVDAMSSLGISFEGNLRITLSDYDVEEFKWNVSLSVHYNYVRELLELLTTGCRDRWGEFFWMEMHDGSKLLKFNVSDFEVLCVEPLILPKDIVWSQSLKWNIVDGHSSKFIVTKKDIVLRSLR